MNVNGSASVRSKQQGAIFAAVNGDGDVFHDVLSIKEGIKPVKNKGAKRQADGDGKEYLFHGDLQVVEVSIVSDSVTLFKVSVTNCYMFLPAKVLHVRKRRVDQW